MRAERQVVYCQTSFPFYKWNWRDFRFDYKIVLFALFTRFAYRINVHRNDFLIVQQEWLRSGLSRLLRVKEEKFIVAPPEHKESRVVAERIERSCFTFLYASTPDCHKNFEFVCEAVSLLEQEIGKDVFKLVLTINGQENKYSKWLHRKYGSVSSIEFAGFMSKEKLFGYYHAVDCLVFPSRVETWGLPITEFAVFNKPMLLSDLPYAHETAAGCEQVAFFHPDRPWELAAQMAKLLQGENSFLTALRKEETSPVAESWKKLFHILLR